MNKTIEACLLSGLAVFVLTAAIIYFTPLKNLNLISPRMNDVDPAVFWKEYSAHPDHYLFIDVRNSTQYQAAHAKGAVNIPAATFYDQKSQFPRSGKEIVLMCGDGRLAAIAYGYLSYYGFLNLIRIAGGLENWTVEGLPVEGTNVSPAVQ